MTMRERMLATLRGEAHDRVPFVQYSGLSAPDREVWDLVGRENMGILRWSRVCKTERPNCRTETMPFERNGRRGEVNRLITPAGVLEQEKVFDPALGSAATRKHFITEPEHYRVFLAYLRDTIIVDDYETFHNDDRLTGDDGLPLVATERTPFQQLWIRWVSLEDLCVHMIEHADLLNDVLAELARIERALSEAIVRAARVLPVRFVDFPDNITAPAIGPRYFREWCVPFYDELADMLTEFDIPVFVHMDGDLGPSARGHRPLRRAWHRLAISSAGQRQRPGPGSLRMARHDAVGELPLVGASRLA